MYHEDLNQKNLHYEHGITRITWLAFILISLVILLSSYPTRVNAVEGQPNMSELTAEGIILRFNASANNSTRQQVLRSAGCSEAKRYRLVPGLTLVNVQPGTSTDTALINLRNNSAVLYAEANTIVSAAAIPNDPRFSALYGLNNNAQTGGTDDADIDAPEAWDTQTGTNIIVAVIDSGLDYNHEDIVGNVWSNPGEIANNRIDDDNNGYVDDIRGWDFANNDNNPFDDNDHGTHVSGTIAAVGNNGIGVTGVNWTAQIMPLKFLNARGSGSIADAISALDYAVMMGARISNNSWGGGAFSQAMFDAIAAAQNSGHLFVAAAGNDGINTDITPAYPASYNLNNIISVAATDDDDALASFSNFGRNTVDLAAPGVSILSTTPRNTYSSFSGTSMATPHVAGAAALVLAEDITLNVVALKAALLDSVDLISALTGISVTGGRLNASTALAGLVSVVVTPNTATIAAGNTQQYTATGGTAPYSWMVSDSNIASINAAGLLTALIPGQVIVSATDANNISATANATITTVVVSPDSASLRITDTLQFSATGGSPAYIWSSSDTTIASIDAATGLLSALTLGTVQVTAMDANGFSDTSGNITVSNIAISPNTAILAVTNTQQFTATGGTEPYTWNSANLAIATISTTGLLTAVSAGTTQITVTDAAGSRITSGDISVLDIIVTPQTATVLINASLQFNASGGTAPYSWTVSDNTVATIDVSTGLLTGIVAGSVVVTATDADGIAGDSGGVTISADHIIEIAPNTASIQRGGLIQFTAVGGQQAYTWSLSNPRAGTINAQTGLFQAGRRPTTTTVIAVDADGHRGESGTVSITRR